MNVRYWRAKKKYTNKVNTTLGPLLLHWPTHQTSAQDPICDKSQEGSIPQTPSSGSALNQIYSYLLMHGILIIDTRLVTVGDNKPYMYIADSGFHACHSNPRLLVWVFISQRISSNKADTFYILLTLDGTRCWQDAWYWAWTLTIYWSVLKTQMLGHN